jgi:nitroreductase/NAD-dependent dihydropyrimidine dehydrogenase PreA subunit
MPKIIIDEELCTRCNTCVAVCPVKIIESKLNTGIPTISEERKDYCLKCGHCESFCKQKALTFDFLTKEKIDITPMDGLLDPQNLALYIKKRRSVRHFSSKPVNKELIAQVIDVARNAASSNNSQPVKWLVIYDSSEVKRIANLTADWMRTIQNTSHPLANYVTPIIFMWNNGVDLICHNAPHLLFAHIPLESDSTDAIIALTHFDIAAPSFGLGTCWIGYVKMAADVYKPLQDALSLPEGRKLTCPMLFGYPTYKVTSIPRRNPVDIKWI